jgi:hypothetical protein
MRISGINYYFIMVCFLVYSEYSSGPGGESRPSHPWVRNMCTLDRFGCRCPILVPARFFHISRMHSFDIDKGPLTNAD